MREFKEETMTALAEGRTALFVLFDFEFLPIRAHSGKGIVLWKDLEWDGVGDALLTNSMCKPVSIGRESHNRGRMSASLPAGGRMTEILDGGYYRNRAMQWSMCAVTPAGDVLEVVLENAGSIVEYTAKDDIVTFFAEDDRLDSQRELDAQHKTKVTAIRKRFKEDLVQSVPSALPGWANTLVGILAGNVLSIVGDMLKLGLATRSRRSFIQRWRARKRLFVFTTEPRIPGFLWRHMKAYGIRADTLEEARAKLYGVMASKAWDFPRGVMMVFVTVQTVGGDPGRLFMERIVMFDIDRERKRSDPERWEQTDPWHVATRARRQREQQETDGLSQ